MHVFTTPTCPHCPRAVNLAHEMAWANANITAYAVEVTEYPDLARRYHVTGVPKTVVDETIEILGAIPEDEFISQSLTAVAGDGSSSAAMVTMIARNNASTCSGVVRACGVAAAVALLASRPRTTASPITYRLTFPAPEHHWMQVEAAFTDLPLGTARTAHEPVVAGALLAP